LHFFRQRTACAGKSALIGGPLLERGGHFLASAGNGIFLHTGDARQSADALMPEVEGFEGAILAPLLFIQATEQQVHLDMQEPLGVLKILLA